MRVQSYDQLAKSLGYNHTGDEVIANLAKALSTTNSGPGGIQGGPLMLENLDGLMTEVLINEGHFKLFNSIPRVPSAQPYYEWNEHKGFGSRRGSVGFGEGGAPKGSVSAFERNGMYNKYLGVKGGVTHQMLLTGQNGGSFEDPTTRENRDRTLELFERMEREFVFGDKTIKNEDGVEVHFDGLLTYMEANAASHVIDLEGAPLDFENLDDTAEKLVTEGKVPKVDGFTSYMSPHVRGGLNKMYQDRNIVRHNKDAAKRAGYTPGFKLPGYETEFGDFAFEHSILLEEVEAGKPEAAAPNGAPAKPASVTSVAGAEAASKMEADTYYYSVGAFNDTGESLPRVGGGVAVTAGQKVTVTIAEVSGATGYRVYRGKQADGSDAKWVGRVAVPGGGGDAEFIDLNQQRTVDANGDLANGMSIIYKGDQRDLCMSQMTPLTKMPLPQVDTTFPFLLLLYCVLVPKALERIFIFKNAGKYNPA